jgi:transposase-like protein
MEKRQYVKYSTAYKQEALKQVLKGESIRGVCRELGISESLFYKGRNEQNLASLGVFDGRCSNNLQVTRFKYEIVKCQYGNSRQ